MAADPWAEHPGRESHPGKGKGKGHPHSPVPEPAATGVLLTGAALVVVAFVRWRAARVSARLHHKSHLT